MMKFRETMWAAMPGRRMALPLLLLLLTAASGAATEFRPLEPGGADAAPAQIVLGRERPAQPQWELSEHAHPARIFGWLDTVGLQLEILVADDRFEPVAERKWLWRGDCLYVEIDGWGDNVDRFGWGVDDLELFLALTADGAYARIAQHGDAQRLGPLPEALFDIEFDGERFRYRLTVPWDYLNAAPGQQPQIGMALIIAHKAEESDADKVDLTWGKRSNARLVSRSLERVQLTGEWPDVAFIGLGARQRLLLPDSTLSIPVHYNGAQQAVLSWRAGGDAQRVAEGRRLQGHLLLNAADLPQNAGELEVVLEVAGQQTSALAQLTTLSQLHGEIQRRIAASDRGHPLSRIHLDGLQALAADCYNRWQLLPQSGLPRTDIEAWAANLFAWFERSLEYLPRDGFNLPQHLRTGMPLYLAFVSDQDGSLQFATLQVPADYDPQTLYPFVVYLHGAGPRVPVDFLLTAVDNSAHDTLWNALPAADDSPQRKVILLAPFGRGTKGYEGMAEQDVWQAMRITESLLSVDPNRRYMTGFSMGCSGAFRLAGRKPHLWAAINLAAGFHPRSETRIRAHMTNLMELPIYVWCGADDTRMRQGLDEVLVLWQQQGLSPAAVIIKEDTPHTYPYFEYARMLEHLLQHTRKPVDALVYAFNPNAMYGFREIPGRNGIALQPASPPTQAGAQAEPPVWRAVFHDNELQLSAVHPFETLVVNPSRFENFASSLDQARPLRIYYNQALVFDGLLPDSALQGQTPITLSLKHSGQ